MQNPALINSTTAFNLPIKSSANWPRFMTFQLPLADAGAGAVSLVPARAVGSGTATFTRATTATTIGPTGLVVSVGTGIARSYYDPTTLTYLGYLSEGARTNLCLQSEAFDNAVWVKTNVSVTANNAIAPDGNTTADTLTATLALGTCLQAITITTASQTASCWVKRRTGAGVINLSADGVTFTPIAVTAAWQRFQVTQSLVAGVINSFFRIDTNGDAIDVWGAQYETAAFASSYIPTTTVAVTRNADVLTYASAGNVLGVTGTSYVEATWANAGAVSGPDIIDTFPSAIQLNISGGGVISLYDGTSRSVGPVVSNAQLSPQKLSSKWDGVANSCNGAASGVLGTPQAWVTPVLGATLYIGNRQGTTNSLFGTIRNVRIFSLQLPDSVLQSMTT